MLVKLKIDELDSAEVPIRVNTKNQRGSSSLLIQVESPIFSGQLLRKAS